MIIINIIIIITSIGTVVLCHSQGSSSLKGNLVGHDFGCPTILLVAILDGIYGRLAGVPPGSSSSGGTMILIGRPGFYHHPPPSRPLMAGVSEQRDHTHNNNSVLPQ